MGKPRKHKRGRPKSARAGCLMCKPHKANHQRKPRHGELRQRPIEEPGD